MKFPLKALARVWSIAGMLLGASAVLAGIAVIVFSIAGGAALSRSAASASEGLSGAQRFLSALTGDFGASSSVVSNVAEVVRLASDALDDTREVLGSTGTALENLVGAGRSAAGDISAMAAAMVMLRQGLFMQTAADLLAAADAGDLALEGMGRLSGRLEDASSALDSVAEAVDSLYAGLVRTKDAIEEAETGVESLRNFSGEIAGSGVVVLAGVFVGVLLVFLGLQQTFIAAGLSGFCWMPGRSR